MRSDKESAVENEVFRKLYMDELKNFDELPEFISTVVDHSVDVEQRNNEVYEIMNLISHAKVVITDRLHCMLFCAVTGTPCVAFDNASHKVRGVYEWIKDLDYITVVEKYNEAVDRLISMTSSYKKAEIPYIDNEFLNLKYLVK